MKNRDGAECDLFRIIAEQGHYAGRTEPTDTRQGIYALAPSGELLASVNTRSSHEMASMLTRALQAWDELPESARYLPTEQVTNRPLRLGASVFIDAAIGCHPCQIVRESGRRSLTSASSPCSGPSHPIPRLWLSTSAAVRDG